MKFFHPTKVKVLKLLWNGKMTLYGMAKVLKIPRENLIWHVNSLKRAGLLLEENEGRKRYYSVNRDRVTVKGNVVYVYLK